MLYRELINSITPIGVENARSYLYFIDEQSRSELFRFTRNISEYVITNNIENLVLVDTSARPAYIGIREYIKSKYPKTPLPRIHFINPKPFQPAKFNEMSIQDLVEAAFANTDGIYIIQNRNFEKMQAEFEKKI